MPIPQESTKISIEFAYEYEIPGTADIVHYSMKFAHTDFGPSVTIQQSGTDEAVELPAEMFGEIANYLSSAGAFRIPKNNTPTGFSSPALPVINRKSTKSSLPSLSRGALSTKLPDVTGVESFTNDPLQVLPQDDSQTENQQETQPLSDLDIEAAAQERLKAKAKANSEKAKIKQIK